MIREFIKRGLNLHFKLFISLELNAFKKYSKKMLYEYVLEESLSCGLDGKKHQPLRISIPFYHKLTSQNKNTLLNLVLNFPGESFPWDGIPNQQSGPC